MRTLLLEDIDDARWHVVSNYLEEGGIVGGEFVPSNTTTGDTTVVKHVHDVDGRPMRLLLQIDWEAPAYDPEHEYFRPKVYATELLDPTEPVRLVTLEDPEDLDGSLQDYFVTEERDVVLSVIRDVGDELQHEI